MSSAEPTPRQRKILEFIDQTIKENGFPPTVREIGKAVGLNSPATVHTHLSTLQDRGYIRRDPTKPRAIEVHWDAGSGAIIDRRPVTHVPVVGDVAAGTGVLAAENIEEVMPLPSDFTGEGDLFMLRVRGDSMIELGILDGDYVVASKQPTANDGDVVVAGIPNDEATVKSFSTRNDQVILTPANPTMSPMYFTANEITIYGKVVSVLRKL
ncbi:MAG: LexA repressor [Actinobacteria bacterium]|nr:LexA repressor [Actinomycetota bacterium]MEC7578844.1 transcriptional repressor LexA [Actinomycetota bacterium]MEC7608198.1 transcriptional repressor LexA [Actinomycetota bacterium]MEC8119704.1 transcriptional repressor LexA [Actinomycetota bacterium]